MTIQLLLLRIGTTLMIGIALGLAIYTVLIAPSRITSNLGMRGLKRQRALAAQGAWSNFEPFVRWLGMRVGRVATPEFAAKIDSLLSQAGDILGLTSNEFIALSVVSSIGLGFTLAILGYAYDLGAAFGALVGLVLGALVPYLQISGIATERLKNISRGLPYTIDLMALSMSAGLDFPGAVRQVVEKSSNPDDPILEEFTLMLQSLGLGRTRKDTLLEFSVRAPVDTVREFVNALVQAEERGNPVADVLTIQAGVSRQRRSTRAEEAASKAGVQMIIPLMLVFFAVLALVLTPAIFQMSKGI
jgi:tight adherence protein C